MTDTHVFLHVSVTCSCCSVYLQFCVYLYVHGASPYPFADTESLASGLLTSEPAVLFASYCHMGDPSCDRLGGLQNTYFTTREKEKWPTFVFVGSPLTKFYSRLGLFFILKNCLGEKSVFPRTTAPVLTLTGTPGACRVPCLQDVSRRARHLAPSTITPVRVPCGVAQGGEHRDSHTFHGHSGQNVAAHCRGPGAHPQSWNVLSHHPTALHRQLPGCCFGSCASDCPCNSNTEKHNDGNGYCSWRACYARAPPTSQ